MLSSWNSSSLGNCNRPTRTHMETEEREICIYLKSWNGQFVSGREIARRAAGKRRFREDQPGLSRSSRAWWKRELSKAMPPAISALFLNRRKRNPKSGSRPRSKRSCSKAAKPLMWAISKTRKKSSDSSSQKPSVENEIQIQPRHPTFPPSHFPTCARSHGVTQKTPNFSAPRAGSRTEFPGSRTLTAVGLPPASWFHHHC